MVKVIFPLVTILHLIKEGVVPVIGFIGTRYSIFTDSLGEQNRASALRFPAGVYRACVLLFHRRGDLLVGGGHRADPLHYRLFYQHLRGRLTTINT